MNMDKNNDETSALNNIYDAIIFKSHRIGHGLGIFKHPNLYQFLKKRNIAIEVCPASNQILGNNFFKKRIIVQLKIFYLNQRLRSGH